MPRAENSTPPEDRLSIRASAKQKITLRRAAELRHTTMSKFVLEASLTEAERVLRQEGVLIVSDEEYEWLCTVMDQAPRDLPELRALLNEKPVWNA